MQWLAVAIGGALGAVSRFGLIKLLPHTTGGFPWPIFVANVSGSLAIGICYVLIAEKGLVPEHWRPLLTVGFLGALTTFSTFALDGVLLWQQGQWQTCVIYIISSVIGCLLCAASGIWLAQRVF